MTTPATLERRRFADELAEVGPDAPTLCEGWAAKDLAAHVILRESRPDAVAGVVVPFLSGYAEKVQNKIADREYPSIVDDIRTGPPIWWPTRIGKIDRLANTTEFFVHLEDLRRAQPDWEPRDLDPELEGELAGALQRMSKLFARKAPAGLVLVPDGGSEIVAKNAEPSVRVSGPVGELIMWIFGRQAHARVEYDGPADAVAALAEASFGI